METKRGRESRKRERSTSRRQDMSMLGKRANLHVNAFVGSQRSKIIRQLGVVNAGKVFDSVFVYGAPPSLTTVSLATQPGVCVNAIAAGSSIFNRIGRKVVSKSIYLTGQIDLDPARFAIATGEPQNYIRLLVVYDNNTNGAPPIYSDVVRSVNTGGTSSTATDQINMDNRERFKIIIDKRYKTPWLAPGGLGVPPGFTQNIESQGLLVQEYRTLRDQDTLFNADTADVGNVVKGGYFVFVHSNTSTTWTFTGSLRFRYYDA